MYCPKCKNEYLDGRTKCTECNCKLVTRLNKEKVINKKRPPFIKQEFGKKSMIYRVSNYAPSREFWLYFSIADMGILICSMILVMIFNDTKNVMLENIMIRMGTFSLCLLCVIVVFFEGKNYLANKFNIKSRILETIVRGVIPVFLLFITINWLIKPCVDYFVRDNINASGQISEITNGRNGSINGLIINGERYVCSNSILKEIDQGEYITFTFGRRSKIIISIKK